MLAGEGRIRVRTRPHQIFRQGSHRHPGPFGATRELVAGFWLIQVKSRDEAIEWMKRAPFDGGSEIEIRQVFDARISAKRDARIARTGTTPPRSGEEIELALVIPGCAAWRRPGNPEIAAPDSGFVLRTPRNDNKIASRTHDHAIHDADDSLAMRRAAGRQTRSRACGSDMKSIGRERRRVLITLDGLHPPSMGARVSFATASLW